MPTKTSGRSSPKRRVRSARICNKRRKRPSTSTMPITASSSISYQASHPSACISGPATPTKRAFGMRALSARMRPAPRISPEVSPATRAIVRGRGSAINESSREWNERRNRQRVELPHAESPVRRSPASLLPASYHCGTAVLYALRIAVIASRLKPRRFRPSMLTPNGVAWLPWAITNGGTSCATPEQPPTITCEPMTQNWCTPSCRR